MACPACACKVHYQYDDGDDCGPHTEGLERCAACGHVFDVEDAADDEDDAYGVTAAPAPLGWVHKDWEPKQGQGRIYGHRPGPDYVPVVAGVRVDGAPSGLDADQLRRIATELEELNLKLHGTEHNGYRPSIVCAAALMRAVAGVPAVDPVAALQARTRPFPAARVIRESTPSGADGVAPSFRCDEAMRGRPRCGFQCPICEGDENDIEAERTAGVAASRHQTTKAEGNDGGANQ